MKCLRRLGWCVALTLSLPDPGAAQEPVGAVSGRVVGPDGEAVAGALVFVGAPQTRFVLTGPDGSFRVELPTSDTLLLGFRAAGFAASDVRLALGPGGARDLGLVSLEAGPHPTATVTGVARDAVSGRPVVGARVELNGAASVLTGEDGAFRLQEVAVEWGRNELTLTHSFFSEVEYELWVRDADREIGVSPQMRPAPLLGVVEDGRPAPPGLPPGFAERRRSTSGYFIDPIEIRERNPTGVTQLVRAAPGVRVRPAPEGLEIVFTRRAPGFGTLGATPGAGACRSPLVFLDGALVEGDTEEYVELDELVSTEDLAGVELYSGASRIPTVFNAMGSGCGVLALWTVHAGLAPTPAAPAAGLRPRSGSRRKAVIVAVLIPAAAYVVKSAICSLPHYCR